MKNLILFLFLGLFVVSCKTNKQFINNMNSSNVEVQDSTKVPGYNESQRAFAYYILSLPKEEKDKWINGMFTEDEKNKFIDTIEYKINN